MSVADASARARRFDALYRDAIDPWNFRGSSYEREKYRATLAALPRPRYRRALEIGCSIGELSSLLRGRADEVLGLDVSTVAIDEARRAHGDTAGLHFETGEVPRDWPPGTFDLVVLSEVLYFLAPDEIGALAAHVVAALEPGGDCVAVCWLGDTDGERDLDGDEAARCFANALLDGITGTNALRKRSSYREPCYRLDVFARVASR